MELWEIKSRLRFRYTREQRKTLKLKMPMTEELFWGCLNTAYCRYDSIAISWLLKTFPQFMRKYHEDYERRFDEDAEFRAEQEAESQRLKALCLAEFGEKWVNENWND